MRGGHRGRRIRLACAAAAVLGVATAATAAAGTGATRRAAPALAPAASSCNALLQALHLCTVTPAPPAPTPGPTATAPASCGGEQPLKANGTPWTCSFDEEFNGTTLDTSKWTVQLTSNSGFTTGTSPGRACYVNTPNNVSVSGGYLHLTARKEATKFTCKSPGLSSFSTQFTAGEVSTWKQFIQTYGRYEVRAQIPQTFVKGLQETLWLWPDNDTKYGAFPASGEIDFAEFYSQYSDRVIPYIHYNYNASTVNTTTNTNIVTNDYTCLLDPTAFHSYVVEWAPGTITLTYDGKPCITDHYVPNGNLKSPQPFDQPFFIALTQALGVGTNAYTTSTPLPATTLVDYVRAWR